MYVAKAGLVYRSKRLCLRVRCVSAVVVSLCARYNKAPGDWAMRCRTKTFLLRWWGPSSPGLWLWLLCRRGREGSIVHANDRRRRASQRPSQPARERDRGRRESARPTRRANSAWSQRGTRHSCRPLHTRRPHIRCPPSAYPFHVQQASKQSDDGGS